MSGPGWRAMPALSVVAAAVVALSHLGCGRRGDDSATPPPRTLGAPEPTPSKLPAEATAGKDHSLAGMRRRVAHFVETGVERYKAKLIRHGLVPPTRLELSILVDHDEACPPKKALMANRVREALTDELSRLEIVALHDRAASSAPDGITLRIMVTTDFETPFRAVHLSVTMDLAGERRVHSDAFDSEGLVCIRCPVSAIAEQTELVVSAVSRQFSGDFPIAPHHWFLLPVAEYDHITVRSETRSWRAPGRVGIQNVWDLTRLAPAGGGDTAPEAPPSPARARARPSAPRLLIARPTDGQRVRRIISVHGTAAGLEGARCKAVVIADLEYTQDYSGTVRNGVFEVPGCIVGRVEDRRQTFRIKAIAQPADGGEAIESPVVSVVRQ